MRTTRPRKTAAIVHKTDVLDYKNLELLEKCISPQGQILPRRRTGVNTQRQRELKNVIKRARHLALLPFVG
jgi:small subunit ribosomal protein S18